MYSRALILNRVRFDLILEEHLSLDHHAQNEEY
jgi:hypothetical protein